MGTSTSEDLLRRISTEFFHTEVATINYFAIQVGDTVVDFASTVGDTFLFAYVKIEADPTASAAAGPHCARLRFDGIAPTVSVGWPVSNGDLFVIRTVEDLGAKMIGIEAGKTHTCHVHAYFK
jgi:hypothetical protein